MTNPIDHKPGHAGRAHGNLLEIARALRMLAALLLVGVANELTSYPVAAQSPAVRLAQPDSSVRTAQHDQTGSLSFLGADPSAPIRIPEAMGEDLSAPDRALAVLDVYAAEFGLTHSAQELLVVRSETRDDGRSSVRYQQVYQGIPVIAGELIVNLDSPGRLLSISGEISPELSLSTLPVVTADQAAATARAAVAKWYGMDEAELENSDPELWILDRRLLRWSEWPAELVWRMDVSPSYLSAVRELVLVNARAGGISLHFNQTDTALNRQVYDNNNTYGGLPGSNLARSEGDGPVAESEVNYAYDYAGDTYDFYLGHHGRDSLDGAGMDLISTVRHCEPGYGCPMANAFWDGTQMAYGDGFAIGDDVVSHELTHGVTEFSSNLFYYYQSGAINESFSDVWGEFVDLTNESGNDSPGVRWQMGEEVPLGAIRDMSDPGAFGDPDRMTSPNYWTSPLDNGGVHSNSGINNKAAFLLVDGGSFNGKSVTGLGIDKTAAIYYEVQTGLLTSGSDYGDLYNALYQGCLNLVGGAAGITNADCQEVRDATEAVEMHLEPSFGFNPEAALCPIGQTPTSLFSDDLESGTGNWQFSALSGPQAWSSTSGYAHSGAQSLWANGGTLGSDSVAQMAVDVALPSGSNAYLWFAHAYDFENPDWDGGFLEFSTNAGGSWSEADGMIDSGKDYDGTISADYDNPNAGEPAYLDTSHGYVSSRVNISILAGQSVRFRWRQSTDSLFGDLGWLVDDVMIYTCSGTTYYLYLPIVLNGFPPNPLNGDFEDGQSAWTEYSLYGWDLILNSNVDFLPVPPHGGSWAVWQGGASGEVSYIEQQVTVPPGSPYLGYWHWVASSGPCGTDYAFVKANSGLVHQYDLCASSDTGGWVKYVVNLSAYQGQTITLQIGVDTPNASNLFLDNVAFQSNPSAPISNAAAEASGEPYARRPSGQR